MNKNHFSFLAIALGLGLLAGGLRFYRLGDWPFYGDELSTFEEVDSLFGNEEISQNSQGYRLPRLIPLGYFVHFLDYSWFGRDEFGSRVLMAILGTLQVVVVFIGLEELLGRPAALATALLLAVWPEHLFHSQQNRFYITAAFFSSLCMLAGAWAVQRRSVGFTLLACAAAFAAILAHTLQGLLLGGLFLAIAAGTLIRPQPQAWRMLITVVVMGVAIGVFALLYLVPLMRGWNSSEGWGYNPLHAVLAAVNQIGWPVALLALLGVACVLERSQDQGWYWLAWVGLWAGAAIILPLIVVFHPAYLFPFGLGVIVLAGMAAGKIYQAFLPRQGPLAWLGIVVVGGINLPGLISHYQDGSRHDFRAAARYIANHWQAGDRIASISPLLLGHYADVCRSAAGLANWNPLPELQKLSETSDRVWIVIPSDRGGKSETVRQWLSDHCSQALEIRRQRFDYRDFVVEIYLYHPSLSLAAKE